MLFQIFDQLVFPAELLVVLEMVDLLMRGQFFIVELWDVLFLTPDDVPAIVFYLLLLSALEGLKDAVGEVGAVSNLGAA